jgi:hypothetical protein
LSFSARDVRGVPVRRLDAAAAAQHDSDVYLEVQRGYFTGDVGRFSRRIVTFLGTEQAS